MKPLSLAARIPLVLFLLAGTTGFAFDQKLPVIDGKETVATVNGEPITVEEFNRALVSLHAARAGKKPAGRVDYSAILGRLINARLILLEARNIGLDELPEIKDEVDRYSRRAMIELLIKRHLRGLEADEEEVEKLYGDAVREWKIRSMRLEKGEDAEKIKQEIEGGGNFDEIAERLVAEGRVEVGDGGEYVRGRDLMPQVAVVLSEMEVGSISPVIPIGGSFVILKLEDTRFPENSEAREWAEKEALNRKKREVMEDYYLALKRKYVKVDQKLLDGLDYESKEPGFQKLLEDRRVIARVKGERSVTVGELAAALKGRFFHGIERAIEGEKVNRRKDAVLEKILRKRVFRREALKQKIERTEAYRNMVKEYESSIIFEAFIQKAVAPDIKVGGAELETFYREHIGEYSYPEMMRIHNLVFSKKENAEEAIDKLEAGVDFRWLRANAEGQVDEKTERLLEFEGRPLATEGLPKGVQKAVSGGRLGDFRLYESQGGYFYVLYIQAVVPAKPKPFAEVRGKIAKRIFDDHLKEAFEDWVGRLREAYEVKIYLTETEG
jgi:hypothetical protein